MDSSEIKGLMKKLGVSQEDIARKLGITRVYVNRVINGERSTKRVRQAISDALGKPYEEVWGDEDQPFLIPEDYQREIKRKRLAPLFELARVSGNFRNNRSIRSLYRDAEKGRLNLITLQGRKKRYYFVRVENPEYREVLELKRRCVLLDKRESKIIRIKVPGDVLTAVDSISDYEGPAYRRFFSFIEKRPEELLKIEFKFYFDEEVEYVERRVRVKRVDLERLLDISRRNNMSLSKVMEILLRCFLSTTYGTIPEEEVIKIKGGKIYYGDMLLTN